MTHASKNQNTRQLQLNILEMSEEDIKALTKTNPFMYYSVPGIHRATMALKDVNFSDKAALCNSQANGQVSLKTRRPLLRSETSVSRRSRVSFEAHPSLLLDDILFDDIPFHDILFDNEDWSDYNDDLAGPFLSYDRSDFDPIEQTF